MMVNDGKMRVYQAFYGILRIETAKFCVPFCAWSQSSGGDINKQSTVSLSKDRIWTSWQGNHRFTIVFQKGFDISSRIYQTGLFCKGFEAFRGKTATLSARLPWTA